MVLFTIGANQKAAFTLESRRIDIFEESGKSHSTYVSLPEARVLELLLRSPGKTISREVLIKYAWAGRPVTAGSLSQAVLNLRKAFGYHGANDAITTVPRVGYKIVATLQHDDTEGGLPFEDKPESVGSGCSLKSVSMAGKVSRKFVVWGAVAVLLNLIAAYLLCGFSSAEFDSSAMIASYRSYKKIGNIEYFVAMPLVGKDGRISQSIENLSRYPPKMLAADFKVGAVYLNGAVSLRGFNYFICSSRFDDKEPDCISYMLVLDGDCHAKNC
ncbi:hypothetical protein FA378_26760 [Pseudomonas aeruginosa]|nr:hypothetical protein [Pseudomonas aeruginosa]